MKKILFLFFVVCGISWLSSCTDDVNSLHDKYLAGGEDKSVGKIDSFKVYPGNGRAMIKFWLSDSRAKKLVIYRADSAISYSVTLPANRKDSIVAYIPNLPEGDNPLTMYSWNADNTIKSMITSTTVRVYGKKYKATLTQRSLLASSDSLVGGYRSFVATFGASSDGFIGIEGVYTDTTGVSKTVLLSSSSFVAGKCVFPSFPFDGVLKYRTMYKPSSSVIDTFKTDYVEVIPQLFSVKAPVVIIPKAGGSIEFTIVANEATAWKITSPVTWMTLSQTSGNGTKVITASATASVLASRFANLTIQNTNLSNPMVKTLRITQK